MTLFQYITMKKYRLLRVVLHFLLINGLFFLTYKLRLIGDFLPWIHLPIPFINADELCLFSLIASASFVSIWVIKSFYPLNKKIINHFQTLNKVWLYWFISIAFLSYFWQGFIFFFWISRFIILVTAVLSWLIILLFDQLRKAFEFRWQKKAWKQILVIAQEGVESEGLLATIRENFELPLKVIGLEKVDEVDFQKYEICIIIWMFQKEILQAIFEKTRMNETRFFHISEWFFLEDVVYTPEILNNIIALEYKHSKLDGRSLILKRVFDLVVASIAIIIFSPVFLIIWILIKLDSPGPIIYRSKRVWKGWNLFTFLKFRTMYTHLSVWYWGKDAEKLYKDLINSDANTRNGILPKIHNDPRVTKIWRFLRKTSLDELPQLFCVLVGTMSIVGPRPHLQNEVEQYAPWERRLLSIKPGITWYAQVFWRDSLDFDQEAQLDLYYIQNRTLRLDIYVIFGTFGVIFKGR